MAQNDDIQLIEETQEQQTTPNNIDIVVMTEDQNDEVILPAVNHEMEIIVKTDATKEVPPERQPQQQSLPPAAAINKKKIIITKDLAMEYSDSDDNMNSGVNELSGGPEENLEANFFKEKVIVEVSRLSWGSRNYLRGCQWSPDGTCCLTAVNGDGKFESSEILKRKTF